MMKINGVYYFVDRTERGDGGEDARATVSDKQVNTGTPRYPVDRYLVECSNKLEIVNIIDDDFWNAEPALRPEDEIVLRKLHDMLQSTADDLKLLSGELSKHHDPGVQTKSVATPLDEDFNEKVHIEELVNAKFYGYNVIEKSQPTPVNAQKDFNKLIKSIPSDTPKCKKVIEAGIQVNQISTFEKPSKKNNLTVSRTKVVQINENASNAISKDNESSQQHKIKINKPVVEYKELSFKYTEPKVKATTTKPLHVQNMPSINIRGELREQKVLQLNIDPQTMHNDLHDVSRNNVAVISIQHEPVSVQKTVPITNINQVQYPIVPIVTCGKVPIRKFYKMSSCESSEVDSNNKVNSFSGGLHKTSHKIIKTVVKLPPKQNSENIKHKRYVQNKKESAQNSNSNLDIWKKKINAVYGRPTTSTKAKSTTQKSKFRKNKTNFNMPSGSPLITNQNTLNNAEYIPYSKLTLGGARLSDIEKELSGIPNRNNVTLGPILNKILSRENSFLHESPRIETGEKSTKILTTSDENLLQEVLDIERKITKTSTKPFTEPNVTFDRDDPLNDINSPDSYVDDFEDDKTDYSVNSEKRKYLSDDDTHSDEIKSGKSHDTNSDNRSFMNDRKRNIQQKTITKPRKLSLKKKVDVFEFVHNIDTQETGTQSNRIQKISLKETQTSPRNDKCNVQPIHNDLWSSIDPKGEVETLFQLEKDFVKKLIFEEYGDLLEKNLSKPSTSKDGYSNHEKNVSASQKNTQTSPAHVKSVMTSPTRTKNRTTSPFTLSLNIDKQTSPMKEELKITIEDRDDLDLSINLSSPRFSLRLPQTSYEVISNLESHAQENRNATKNDSVKTRVARKNLVSSSSSADCDYSSSDISSLGEVRLKLKRNRKLQIPNPSELSSSSTLSKCISDISDTIIPIRSEGELSVGQVNRLKTHKNIKSDGEASLGFLH